MSPDTFWLCMAYLLIMLLTYLHACGFRVVQCVAQHALAMVGGVITVPLLIAGTFDANL